MVIRVPSTRPGPAPSMPATPPRARVPVTGPRPGDLTAAVTMSPAALVQERAHHRELHREPRLIRLADRPQHILARKSRTEPDKHK